MARQTHEREDLLRDAVALVERAAIQINGRPDETVVFGFRREGSFSVFFGEDPAIHFRASGELRRAFVDGRLIKAEGSQLSYANRSTSVGRIQIESQRLAEEEANELLEAIVRRLDELRDALANEQFTLVGQALSDADVIGRTLAWLQSMPHPIRIAKSPHVG